MGANVLALLGKQAGEAIASGVGGGLGQQASYGIGQLTGYNKAIANDQYNQQKRLSEMQQKMNFESMDKAQQLQKDMIDYTDPKHQMQRLEAAGLNTAMIYGGTGAGGSTQTTGNVSPMGIQGGHASGEAERKANDLATVGMGLQLQKMQSEIDVNKSVANANNASAGLSGAKTETENASRTIAIENMRQAGISNWLENQLKQYKLTGEDSGAVRNAVLNVYTSVDANSLEIRELNNSILKTMADTGNANAQALLTNKRAEGYAQELINATVEADADKVKAAAIKLSAEWDTGEFTNWKTWVELGQQAVNTVVDAVTGISKMPQLNKPEPKQPVRTESRSISYDKKGRVKGWSDTESTRY